MSITKQLDEMAVEMFGEFGFSTCSYQEQDIIVNELYTTLKQNNEI
tara:strand:- start:549 stop:686 length:138 start_codon:yes stop_codon:yes gene_type:complete